MLNILRLGKKNNNKKKTQQQKKNQQKIIQLYATYKTCEHDTERNLSGGKSLKEIYKTDGNKKTSM